jgi:hypothetical protein
MKAHAFLDHHLPPEFFSVSLEDPTRKGKVANDLNDFRDPFCALNTRSPYLPKQDFRHV